MISRETLKEAAFWDQFVCPECGTAWEDEREEELPFQPSRWEIPGACCVGCLGKVWRAKEVLELLEQVEGEGE